MEICSKSVANEIHELILEQSRNELVELYALSLLQIKYVHFEDA